MCACTQCAVCYTFVLSFLFGHFRFIHFFYTNWWLFTAFVHHMLTERMLQTRNHHSQHMHTTDSFNICFCSSFCSPSPPSLASFGVCILVELKIEERWKEITRTHIDHHFHTFEKSERNIRVILHSLNWFFLSTQNVECG